MTAQGMHKGLRRHSACELEARGTWSWRSEGRNQECQACYAQMRSMRKPSSALRRTV